MDSYLITSSSTFQCVKITLYNIKISLKTKHTYCNVIIDIFCKRYDKTANP